MAESISSFEFDSLGVNDADFIEKFLYYRMTDPDPEKRAKATKHVRTFLGLRLTYDVYKRLTNQEEKQKLEAAFVLKIADYVKKNPRSSDDEKAAFIKQEMEKYTAAMKNL